ncbi:MAG: phosphotransferase family protein, partial [Gammaproteobacteria bacterium]|nr:phosphotransferase family protein [Gammaproteobacteria bacterium]
QGSGPRRLIARSDPPAGTAIIESDRTAEWHLLNYLKNNTSLPIPAPLYFDKTGRHLGAPTIVSEFVDGQSLTVVASVSELARRRELYRMVAKVAADVYNAPLSGIPSELRHPGDWNAYMNEQIALWADTEKAGVGSDPFMRYVGAWLEANRPAPAPLTLVHGDFQSSNMLLDQQGELCLIDWELTHIGDPREDLGWFGLVSIITPPDVIGDNIEDFCSIYRELTGLSETVINPQSITYFTLLSSFRVFAGILAGASAMDADLAASTAIAYTILIQSSVHGIWENILGASIEAAELEHA